MDYLKLLRENPDLAKEFDILFDFFLLDELSPRDEAEGRCTFTLPGMAFARDGSGGEYHLLEDGSIGYYSSEAAPRRLAPPWGAACRKHRFVSHPWQNRCRPTSGKRQPPRP